MKGPLTEEKIIKNIGYQEDTKVLVFDDKSTFPSFDVCSAVEGLKGDIERWDSEKIQGVSKQTWDKGAIMYFIDKWFPVFKKRDGVE